MPTTHWMSNTRFCKIYRIWKRRCENSRDISYKNYWWRWIKRTRKCFEDFRDDMYQSYIDHVKQYWEKQTTLDRLDNNKDYSKNNCKRSTYEEQQNHRRNNTIVTIFWETMTVQAAYKKFGKVNEHTFRTRYCRWWDLDDCLLLWKQKNHFNYKKYRDEKLERTVSLEEIRSNKITKDSNSS